MVTSHVGVADRGRAGDRWLLETARWTWTVMLGRSLDAVVEDCVNTVGVGVNTAPAALLTHVSGRNPTLAANIVGYRDAHGPFADRRQLRNVPRLGDKTFEQAAGFLRIRNGGNPLDASGRHPESYPVAERILADLGLSQRGVLGDSSKLRAIRPEKYATEAAGALTIRDIVKELEKSGRNPRPAFRTATFADGVERLEGLKPGMRLEGTVTNVTNFGAFIDVGVHQDGLVHISALSHRFVKDPHSVVKADDVVTVKAMEVDIARRRIALTMRLDDGETARPEATASPGTRGKRGSEPKRVPATVRETAAPAGAMAAAFARLKR